MVEDLEQRSSVSVPLLRSYLLLQECVYRADDQKQLWYICLFRGRSIATALRAIVWTLCQWRTVQRLLDLSSLWRECPISKHVKFLERNKNIIIRLLARSTSIYSNRPVPNYCATNMAPALKDQFLLFSKKVSSLGINKNLLMIPNWARKQERLCWRGPTATIYCYTVLCFQELVGYTA
jgi:hypothetical protein